MRWFHFFFFVICLVSVARVSINIMIFTRTVKDAHGITFLTFESYAIMTELCSCLILHTYYRSVTRKTQRASSSLTDPKLAHPNQQALHQQQRTASGGEPHGMILRRLDSRELLRPGLGLEDSRDITLSLDGGAQTDSEPFNLTTAAQMHSIR